MKITELISLHSSSICRRNHQIMHTRCYCCYEKFVGMDDVVGHSIDTHPSKELCILRQLPDETSGKLKYKALHYKIVPSDLDGNTKITVDNLTCQLIFRRRFDYSKSPISKVAKLSSAPTKENPKPIHFTSSSTEDLIDGVHMLPIHNELHHIGTETDDSVSISVSDMSAEDQSIIKEMLELFPTILSALKPTGRLWDWTNFIKLLADGTLPVDNLAFQLLMDVSKWYSSETVYGMLIICNFVDGNISYSVYFK